MREGLHLCARLGTIAALLVFAACSGGHPPNPVIAARDCEQCHVTEHDLVESPVHRDVIPFKCVACHNTVSWFPSDNRGHDKLTRISAGNHSGLDCRDCHLEESPPVEYPEGFFDFSCIGCHSHAESSTNSKHGGVGGYAYEPRICLRCHLDRTE